MLKLWRVDVRRRDGRPDPESDRVREALAASTARISSLYLLEGPLTRAEVERIAAALLADPVTETWEVRPAAEPPDPAPGERVFLLFRRPGVMDPVEDSARKAIGDLGLRADRVRTGRRLGLRTDAPSADLACLIYRTLANAVVDEVVEGERPFTTLAQGRPYAFRRVEVPIRGLPDGDLARLSGELGLALDAREMRAVVEHFERLGRDPTDAEIETIAQTWSEHCKHKTFTGIIEAGGTRIDNLLKSTIMKATAEIAPDWCWSVFKDNAGVVAFDDEWGIAVKVETHNHPSAIDPYGGANTGLGGVIRDILGCGLGAKPIFSTDVFCVGPPDQAENEIPPGVLSPRRLLDGVIAGVRDYGNRMGIPTVSGGVFVDPRYTANPLVYCGTGGLIPRGAVHKEPRVGDHILLAGGRTGRDGIHGATFSSVERTDRSEELSAGAVQIGNAIVEKRLQDALLAARDAGLYHAVTDCGAGGLSSAVGEMGEKLGAEVHLERVPLKYEGLTAAEIWISEAQERMVLAVPPDKIPELQALFAREGVETTDLGQFTGDGRLRLLYAGQPVADLDMGFLHGGNPRATRTTVLSTGSHRSPAQGEEPPTYRRASYGGDLRGILAQPNTASKEWIVRQYDHEVQGGTFVKPFVGARVDGPSDAAVIRPLPGSMRGVAVACGLNPRYGDLDAYAMAASAVDEAVRNVVAVGARPDRIALLDNFCWGNPEDPAELGALVEAAQACHDVAVAYRTPFVSGKDSLNNEFRAQGRRIPVPHTLLITAVGIVDDIARCVTMDAKSPEGVLYVVGRTFAELGGSALHALRGLSGGRPPGVRVEEAPAIFAGLHRAISQGLVRACHDLSEGGLAVAAAEMAIGGDLGVELDAAAVPCGEPIDEDGVVLFSESNTRFLVEVRERDAAAFEACLPPGAAARIGSVSREALVRVRGRSGGWIVDEPVEALRAAWQTWGGR